MINDDRMMINSNTMNLKGAQMFCPTLTKDDVVDTFLFHGRLAPSFHPDSVAFIFTTAPRSECLVVGEKGYFESRFDKLPVYGDYADMVKQLNAILNGDPDIDDASKIHYPRYILEYANFHSMRKRDAHHLEQVKQLESAHSAEIEKLEKKLGMVKLQKQGLSGELARAKKTIDEKTLANKKLDDLLTERNHELAEENEAHRQTRMRLAGYRSECRELRRDLGIDVSLDDY